MTDISKINGLSITDDVVKVNGVTKSNIEKINGLTVPAGGSTITIKFANSPTMSTDTSTHQDGYDALVFTGRSSGDIITINISHSAFQMSDAAADIYWRKNNARTWTLLHSYSGDGNGTESLTGIDDDDTVGGVGHFAIGYSNRNTFIRYIYKRVGND